MKITVIGGGSTYTPELVEGFARRADVLTVDELVLQDIDPDRLQVVGGLAERILRRTGFPGRLTLSTDLSSAVDGAAAVLIQLRVGGQHARLRDETLPGKFGLLGQETTGAGGFAKAMRTVPVVLDIADHVRRLAPDAWIVDFTNPVGIVTRALQHAGHRAVGLCNVAIGFQRRIAAQLGVDHARLRLGHHGLNHLSWISSVELDGVDVLPELLEGENLDKMAREVRIAPALLTTLGAIPSYYLHYYYCTDEEIDRQRAGNHRAQEVLAIEEELLTLYRDPGLDHKPELLERRGGAYYSEAAAALVTSLFVGDDLDAPENHHYVDVRNGTTIAGLPPDAVVEVPARVDRTGVHPLPVPPLPPEQLGLVQAVTAYETLTVEAAVTGDRRTAARALLANPLVRQWPVVEPLLAELVPARD